MMTCRAGVSVIGRERLQWNTCCCICLQLNPSRPHTYLVALIASPVVWYNLIAKLIDIAVNKRNSNFKFCSYPTVTYNSFLKFKIYSRVYIYFLFFGLLESIISFTRGLDSSIYFANLWVDKDIW